MSLSPQMEKAWRVDEAVRFVANVAKEERNAYWRNKILTIEEWNLPDYERPTMFIPRVNEPIAHRVKRGLKSLLP